MFKLRSRFAASLLGLAPALLLAAPTFANSLWLPTRGSLNTSAAVVYETFDQLYAPSDLVDFPFESLDQVTAMFGIEYAFLEWLSFDVELGLGKVLPHGFGLAGSAGVRDRNNGIPLDWHLRADAFYTVPK